MEEEKRPYYDMLLARKERGEKLNLQDLNFDNLRQLWWFEICYDDKIAELFDVTIKEAKNYRYKLNVKQQYMQELDYRKKIDKYLDMVEMHKKEMCDSYEKKINELKRRIKELEKNQK
ncbi:hypothetical protein [Desulfosporosinus nitroreducens]|uniref:hypothetical protein n=1 Tax=Desulfosporosinus nitroreducens TaxID=2018668 RepID=UPI00207D6DA1|nr:hypothetical protein [Desulfosporosinus nitroreducens]MCO1600028.1 hypothetical protein [Desulfosporosinus nitroreducens]